MKENLVLFSGFFLAWLCSGAQTCAQKFEAENATLTNGAVKTRCVDCSEGYAVEQREGNLLFEIFLPDAGFYAVYIHAASPGGDKTNTLRIDENKVEFFLGESSRYHPLKLVSGLKLSAGTHTVEILKSWGWINIDFIEWKEIDGSERFDLTQTLASPDPTRETLALFGFLLDHYDKRIISGVMTLDSLDEAIWLKEKTGKSPALLGIDFMHSGRGYGWYNDRMPVINAKTWYERNGIPALMWHWRDPLRKSEEFYTKTEDKPGGTLFDISGIFDENSAEYKAIMSDIDYTAGLLHELQEENIPVLWRPLHEAAGGWFWWGARGPEPCKRLWRLMFDRMVHYHGLRNLIWVWTSESGDEGWYPGDAYVDIIGRDMYDEGNHSSRMITFGNLNDRFKGKKMIALTESGSFPDPDNLMKDGAGWSWFMPWYGVYTRNNPRNNIHNPLPLWKKALNHEYVITLDEMPDLRTYQRQVVEALTPGLVVTGIDNTKRSFTAFPVCVDNELILNSDKRIEVVTVFNALGRCVRRQSITGERISTVVSFSGLASGIYLVTVNGSETVRVLKK